MKKKARSAAHRTRLSKQRMRRKREKDSEKKEQDKQKEKTVERGITTHSSRKTARVNPFGKRNRTTTSPSERRRKNMEIKRQRRLDPAFLEAERLAKREKRRDPSFKNKEKSRKRLKRENAAVKEREKVAKQVKRQDSDRENY